MAADISILFPVRQGVFRVFHKTVVDWIQSEHAGEFRLDMRRAHDRFAGAFARLDYSRLEETPSSRYHVCHGVQHMVHAGRAPEAARLYGGSLELLEARVRHGFRDALTRDYIAIRRAGCGDGDALRMKAFAESCGRRLSEMGPSVWHAAVQQPDTQPCAAAP